MKAFARIAWLVCLAAAFLFGSWQLVQYGCGLSAAQTSEQAALELVLPSEAPVVSLPESRVPLRDIPVRQEDPAPTPVTLTESKPADEHVQYLLSMDLEALRAVNFDVLGWIYIPDSAISFPLMEADDNQEYLYHTWDKKSSKYGSIFLECRNSRDLSDFNTLIYGHNMLTEHMFGTLTAYKDQSYLDAHPCVYIRLNSGVYRYRIFSVYEAQVVSNTYRLIFEDDVRKQEALDLYTSSNWLESEIQPTTADRILTLSTCTGRGTDHLRFVVQAVLETAAAE